MSGTGRGPGLGGQIRERRLKRGLTQAQLGAPHFSSAYMSLLESGRRQPSLDALRHIADRLGVRVNELVDERQGDTEVLLEFDLHEARHMVDQGDLARARPLVEKASEEAESYGLTRVRARSEELLGAIAERETGPKQGLEHYERAEELWRDEPTHLRFETIAGIARCTDQLGDAQMAIYLLESYKRELVSSDMPHPVALMRINSALIHPYFSAGLPEKASEAAQAALKLEARVEDADQLACMHLTVARSMLYEGQLHEALASIRTAEQIYLSRGWRNQQAKAKLAQAIVLSKKSDFVTAKDELQAALELLRQAPDRLDEALALNELGYVMRHLGDVEGAQDYLERAQPLLEDAHTIEKAFNQREIGLCLTESEPEVAEHHLKLAIDWYRISGAAAELATTFKALGELYLQMGRNEEAIEAFRDGLASVEERSA